MDKTICELFAGVGGFRLGFDRLNSGWETVWFSQWEPLTKSQWAYDCYIQHFGDSLDINGETHTNEDISTIDKHTIPDHSLLVAGFPCQDYSVAKTLSTSKGIEGKKGVLWWDIYDTIVAKKPPFVLLENVDRLIKSPAYQRGRDFGIILSCFHEQGYTVEWRIVNAAEYGGAQRRKRIFIFAYLSEGTYGQQMASITAEDIVTKKGFMTKAFPISKHHLFTSTTINTDILSISDEFTFGFGNAGLMRNGEIITTMVYSKTEKPILLGSVLESNVDEQFYIPEDKMHRWEYLKGQKSIPRVSKTGFEYTFSEGAIAFPDPLDRPSRTMLTSEAMLNRSTHVVEDPQTKRLRVLTPVEAERLNGFDDNWTDTGMGRQSRYFCMGNALVVPMITRMGAVLDNIINLEKGEKKKWQ